MMSHSQKSEVNSDELLSAYFDGELPPPQAAQVEGWLAQSPEARGKLEDYQRLSAILREMPRCELPSEFAGEVLHHVERQMLLPASMASRSPWRKARFWTLSVVAPVAATAALLFIAFRPTVPPTDRGSGLADRHPSKPIIEIAALAHDDGHRQAPSSPNAHAPAASAAVASHAPRDHAGSPEASSTVSADVSAEPVAAEKAATVKALAEPAIDDGAAARLASLVGGIRAASERGQMAVVRVFVVDRRDGLDLVQLVLDEHQISRDVPEVAAEADARTEAPAEAERRGGEQPSGHEALFVVADAEKLQVALRELFARREPTLDWKLEEPIDLRRVDSPSQKRIEEALIALGEAGRNAAVPEIAAQRSAATQAPAEGTGAGASVPSAATRPAVGLANVHSEAKKPVGAAARQFRVVLADSSAQEIAFSVDRAAVEAADRSKEGATTSHEEGASKRALVRVIFVVEPRAPAEPPGNARPADETPGGGAA